MTLGVGLSDTLGVGYCLLSWNINKFITDCFLASEKSLIRLNTVKPLSGKKKSV